MIPSKQKILDTMLEILEERISVAKASLEDMRALRDQETKSSAGDKYETGRSLVQMEMHKIDEQLDQYFKMQQALNQIQPESRQDHVDFGSLVYTNNGLYFMSIGLGPIELDGDKIFCISMASPIGKSILNKKQGDTIDFQNKKIAILEVN
jgi:transcription elongation GreA/GreB family factor